MNFYEEPLQESEGTELVDILKQYCIIRWVPYIVCILIKPVPAPRHKPANLSLAQARE